jgi:hypothetical protein
MEPAKKRMQFENNNGELVPCIKNIDFWDALLNEEHINFSILKYCHTRTLNLIIRRKSIGNGTSMGEGILEDLDKLLCSGNDHLADRIALIITSSRRQTEDTIEECLIEIIDVFYKNNWVFDKSKDYPYGNPINGQGNMLTSVLLFNRNI